MNFQERATPGIIRTVDGAKARGRFWIEADSGRIRETELLVNTARAAPDGRQRADSRRLR